MTREEQGRDPQDVERPLASTRWSEPGATADDELLPPFMPGRGRQPPAERAPEPADSQPESESPAEPDWAGADPEVAEPVSGGFVTDHQDAVADTGEAVTGGDEAVTEEEAFPFETPGTWDEPYLFDSDPQEADEGRDLDLGGGAVSELAERLEDLAARIRADGADGARAGMTSGDRLTALLSTLIAGYLEGREG